MTYDPDASMTPKEEEDFLLIYGSRKERKAIKERRKAREQAQKQSSTGDGYPRG